MTNLRIAYLILAALALLIFAVAIESPRLLTSPQYLGALLMAEVLAFGLWHYERSYYPFLLLTFLWAGIDFPLRSAAQTARWVVLGAAAWAGFIIWNKRKGHRFGIFHFVAFSCVSAALASALVSDLPKTAWLKAGSLALLFLYCASGLRVAFLNDPEKFIRKIVWGCEILMFVTAFCYLVVRFSLYGNPNALGGVIAFILPLLLWGALTTRGGQYYRYLVALILAAGLLYGSVARAAFLASATCCAILLVALRRERLLFKGCLMVTLVLTLLGVFSPRRFNNLTTNFISEIIYKNNVQRGVLASRRGPWNQTVTSIKTHPWFGSGYGTRTTSTTISQNQDWTISNIRIGEYANSYLAIADYMGFVGMATFGTLLLLIIWRLARVWIWIRRTGNVHHYIVPIAIVVTTGLVHAGFEDWLTAPGSYFCVLFWPFVFLLIDFRFEDQPVMAKRVMFSQAQYVPAFGMGQSQPQTHPPRLP